ncbi:MAG: MarR family transcriptional regulator [Proteobacteria bacterium]|nr:MarR family transcriptional regulator [Pseudomonadota bacterium]
MSHTLQPDAPVTAPALDGFPYDEADYLFHLMVAVTRYRDADLEKAVKPLDLNLSYYRAMVVMAHFAPCSMSELADFSMVDRTTLTRTVDQLVARGLVERGPAKVDRRQVMLTLTESGWARYLMAQEVVRSRNETLTAGLSPHLVRAMIRAQQALVTSWSLGEDLTHRLLTLRRPDRAPAAAND